MMVSQLLQSHLLSPSIILASKTPSLHILSSFIFLKIEQNPSNLLGFRSRSRSRRNRKWVASVTNKDVTEVSFESTSTTEENSDPDPQELEYVAQIKRVLELLKTNRDMTFNEVKLTISIEDPRDVERKRLLGIDDENAPTRDDLAAVLEEVNEGKIPEDRLALQMLAEEMTSWPNLEVEVTKKKKPTKSLYAKATDTGIDPREAANRLKVDWDEAAEIEDEDGRDDVEVPPAVVRSFSETFDLIHNLNFSL